ncbi:hypothetical protein ACFYE2_17020 [Kocuria sp. CPCC 205300]|uniref:hypothetical protein n=1 Tax=Kocuria sabuli TaxID=3071448 RepID=UPI0036DAFCE8
MTQDISANASAARYTEVADELTAAAYTWSKNLIGRCSHSSEGCPCLHGHANSSVDGR